MVWEVLDDNIKIYTVKWGNWIDDKTLELKISRDEFFVEKYWGELKVKITVEAYPDEVGMIRANLR